MMIMTTIMIMIMIIVMAAIMTLIICHDNDSPHFWCTCICAPIFMRVENGLIALGWILGRQQMNARIKAQLTIIVSGRSESYNRKCVEDTPKMHQKCTEKYTEK